MIVKENELGFCVQYSPVNQAYFVMFCGMTLSVINDKQEAIEEFDRLTNEVMSV